MTKNKKLSLISLLTAAIGLILFLSSAQATQTLEFSTNYAALNMGHLNVVIEARANGGVWQEVWRPLENTSSQLSWQTLPLQSTSIDGAYDEFKISYECLFSGSWGCKINNVYFAVNGSGNLIKDPCFNDFSQPSGQIVLAHWSDSPSGMIGLSNKGSNPICEGTNQAARIASPRAFGGVVNVLSQTIQIDGGSPTNTAPPPTHTATIGPTQTPPPTNTPQPMPTDTPEPTPMPTSAWPPPGWCDIYFWLRVCQ